jgi:hypothetical protein
LFTDQAHGTIKTPGQIIIHDRDQLQAQVLPLYFNHASFSSLRRQLSYFSFIRITKGRQNSNITCKWMWHTVLLHFALLLVLLFLLSLAAPALPADAGRIVKIQILIIAIPFPDINEGVVELGDILRLKRKVMGNTPSAAAIAATTSTVQPSKHENKLPRDQSQESPRAVALAVSSGKLHASEANNDLDTKENINQSLDADTCKSISSSPSLVFKPTVASKIVSREKKHRKITRKTSSRVKKLLYLNKIVPFINLLPRECMPETDSKEENRPQRLVHPSSQKISGSETSDAKKAGSTTGNDSSGNSSPCSRVGKDGNANESMVGALLALKGGN